MWQHEREIEPRKPLGIFDLLFQMSVYCDKDAGRISGNGNAIPHSKHGLKELRETDTLRVSGDVI